MSTIKSKQAFRLLVLIGNPKLAEKASEILSQASIPLQFQTSAVGTAPSDMIDILGLGTPDRTLVLCTLPLDVANETLRSLKRGLRLGSVNSGIAFTIPVTGASNIFLSLMQNLMKSEDQTERKETKPMTENKYSLIAAIVNPGYSEELMDVAREAGARGGTVLHSRQVGETEALTGLGLTIQDEKEIVIIVADQNTKLGIMQAIGNKCGMHSDAKGFVLSLPIDGVVGVEE